MRIRKTVPSRKQRFESALKLARMSGAQWRTEVYPVSWQHLDKCFKGEREMSAKLAAAIDSFIDETFRAHGFKQPSATASQNAQAR